MVGQHSGRELRRRLEARQQQVEDLPSRAEQQFDTYLLGRFARLGTVRRFVIGWLLLVVLLIGVLIAQNLILNNYYQSLRPVPGGIYSEGELGTFTNANPLFATSDVDTSVSHLLFAGLFTYNDKNQLVGDLASSISPDQKGTVYTVKLKPHLTWHDGQPLTSRDVLFTYQTIQNPDAQSPLQPSWRGITLSAPDASTVIFKLPSVLASFPTTLTNGIVPEHVLSKLPVADLRTADFNTVHPIGAGPFAWQAIQVSGTDPRVAEEQIALTPFANYQGGKPKLQQFIVHAFASQDAMIKTFHDGQLTAVKGLAAVPPELAHQPAGMQQHNLLLSAGTYAFFKTSTGPLADAKVRQALVKAADVPAILTKLGYPTKPVREPLLTGQLGYQPSLTQSGFDLAGAQSLLDQAGWVKGSDGMRSKSGQPLAFTLTASDTPEYRTVTKLLQQDWQPAGAKVSIRLESDTDFQSVVAYHDYDALLYGISIGTDPDVYVYWDSSQADIRSANRLNLSEYKSATADAALEGGRTRLDPNLRILKYKPFLQAWQQDAPALGLYQPRLLYLTNGPVAGLHDHTINTASDRFNNVQNWEIREARVSNH